MLSATTETNNEAVTQFMSRLQADFQTALEQLHRAGEMMKKIADRWRREELVYNPGDFVLLSTRHLRMRNRPAKLQRQFVGPFRVSEQISRVAYKLKLPAQWHIHPVFHNSLLKPWQVSRVPFVHGTIPRPSAFTVRLSDGLEMQLRVGQQAADKLSSGSVRRTEAIVAKRRSVRFTCSTSKGPGVRHTIHRQE